MFPTNRPLELLMSNCLTKVEASDQNYQDATKLENNVNALHPGYVGLRIHYLQELEQSVCIAATWSR